MRTRNRSLTKRIIIVLLALISVSCLAYYIYLTSVISEYNRVMREEYAYFTPDPLSGELTTMFSRYESGKLPFVDLKKATPFSWERLYVFGPYTSLKVLDDRFGLSWRKNCFTEIDGLESYALLVFTEADKIVHCFEYSTYKYHLNALAKYSSGIPIQDAKFILDDNYKPLLVTNRE